MAVLRHPSLPALVSVPDGLAGRWVAQGWVEVGGRQSAPPSGGAPEGFAVDGGQLVRLPEPEPEPEPDHPKPKTSKPVSARRAARKPAKK